MIPLYLLVSNYIQPLYFDDLPSANFETVPDNYTIPATPSSMVVLPRNTSLFTLGDRVGIIYSYDITTHLSPSDQAIHYNGAIHIVTEPTSERYLVYINNQLVINKKDTILTSYPFFFFFSCYSLDINTRWSLEKHDSLINIPSCLFTSEINRSPSLRSMCSLLLRAPWILRTNIMLIPYWWFLPLLVPRFLLHLGISPRFPVIFEKIRSYLPTMNGLFLSLSMSSFLLMIG